MASIESTLPALTSSQQYVVLIRLANELEDYLDRGLCFCANASDRIARARARLDRQASLAQAIGYERLSAEMRDACAANVQGVLPAGVRTDQGHSSLRVPRSYAARITTVLRSRATRLIRS